MALAIRSRTVKTRKLDKLGRRGKATPVKPLFQARTKFGRELLAIRAKIEASGVPLLSLDEINRELGRDRGDEP